jgi:hypothetical protein
MREKVWKEKLKWCEIKYHGTLAFSECGYSEYALFIFIV